MARRDRWPLATVAAVGVLTAAVAFRFVGIPDVPLMQPLYALGVVLPGCGLTRATVALVGGDLSTAWAYNPASYVVAVAVSAALVRAGAGVAFGRWVHVRLRASPALFGAVALAVGVLWLRQQRSAELLMR